MERVLLPTALPSGHPRLPFPGVGEGGSQDAVLHPGSQAGDWLQVRPTLQPEFRILHYLLRLCSDAPALCLQPVSTTSRCLAPPK